MVLGRWLHDPSSDCRCYRSNEGFDEVVKPLKVLVVEQELIAKLKLKVAIIVQDDVGVNAATNECEYVSVHVVLH